MQGPDLMTLACFKAYDIRGRVPSELNPELARRMGQEFAELTQAHQVAVGYDMRPSSPELAEAVVQGLLSRGVEVIELGLCGTEEVYFAAFHGQLQGGLMITASHNPADYNGLKLVGHGARPLSESDLQKLQQRVLGPEGASTSVGKRVSRDFRAAYVDQLLQRFPPRKLARLKMLGNPGNGSIGPLLKQIQQAYQFDLTLIQAEPDGTFPNGIPNPLLPDKRQHTTDAVLSNKAELGIAWDGDFDRCFFFDSRGQMQENYYLVGLLAEHYLRLPEWKGAPIAYDPRLTWNTEEVIQQCGGTALPCRTGHVFFKQAMREHRAPYGGEMSGHHYFGDFGYCDSGVYPWLLYLSLQSERSAPMEQRLWDMAARFPISGEINRKVEDTGRAIQAVEQRFAREAVRRLDVDGLSLEFPEWRFNLRRSNTEPLTRLNVESRGDAELVSARTAEILALY
jgi:phosphomannomutase